MNARGIKKLVDQVEEILIAHGAPASVALASGRPIVELVLPLIERVDQHTLERLRAIAASALKLGHAHELIERSADSIAAELETMLVGHGCENCGREVRKGEGAFEVVIGEGIVITCGRCDEPKRSKS